jgi:hypothetical protein
MFDGIDDKKKVLYIQSKHTIIDLTM